MKAKFRYILLLLPACCAVISALVLVSYAQSSRSERKDAADDDPLSHPLPPGIRVRAFIHTPRVVAPSHLGECKPTSFDENWYAVAPWRLPSAAIIWKLSEATVPTGLSVNEARDALTAAFATWNTYIADTSVFSAGGKTAVKNARLDGTNAILWKKLRAGVLGETYVWYDASGVVVEADTVFNNAHPWRMFHEDSDFYTDASGDCSTEFDAYDLQNIATHEFGHWIGLADVFAEDVTMFLFGAGGELKKRSLGLGDILGACFLYNSNSTACPP